MECTKSPVTLIWLLDIIPLFCQKNDINVRFSTFPDISLTSVQNHDLKLEIDSIFLRLLKRLLKIVHSPKPRPEAGDGGKMEPEHDLENLQNGGYELISDENDNFSGYEKKSGYPWPFPPLLVDLK